MNEWVADATPPENKGGPGRAAAVPGPSGPGGPLDPLPRLLQPDEPSPGSDDKMEGPPSTWNSQSRAKERGGWGWVGLEVVQVGSVGQSVSVSSLTMSTMHGMSCHVMSCMELYRLRGPMRRYRATDVRAAFGGQVGAARSHRRRSRGSCSLALASIQKENETSVIDR